MAKTKKSEDVIQKPMKTEKNAAIPKTNVNEKLKPEKQKAVPINTTALKTDVKAAEKSNGTKKNISGGNGEVKNIKPAEKSVSKNFTEPVVKKVPEPVEKPKPVAKVPIKQEIKPVQKTVITKPEPQKKTEPVKSDVKKVVITKSPTKEVAMIDSKKKETIVKESIPEKTKSPAKEIKKPEQKKEPVKEIKKPEPKKEPAKEIKKPEVKEIKKPELKKEPVKEIKKPEPKKEPVKEIKKPEPKKEPVKEIKKPEVKDIKKVEPKKEPAKEIKKTEPKKEPAKEIKKTEPKKEPVKEIKKPELKKEPVKEIKKPEPKKEPAKEIKKPEIMEEKKEIEPIKVASVPLPPKKEAAVIPPPPVKEAPKKPQVRYSDEDLKMFEEKILEFRHDALEELGMLRERLEDLTNYDFAEESMIYSMHMAEQGSEALEKEKTYAQIQRINEYIKKLDDALQRIKDKTYGICRMCGILIAKERLLAVPITTLSAAYKIHKRCPENNLDLIEPVSEEVA